jgi:hypothetical protein
MVAVVPTFDEPRGGGSIRRFALCGTGRLSGNDRRGEKEGGDEGRKDSIDDRERHAS